MPIVNGKEYAYTEEGIAAAEKAKKRSGFKMKSGNTIPFKQMGSSPTKHSGAEMFSAESNTGIDRGHDKEDNPEYKTIIKNRKTDEARHDAYHTKYGSDPTHTATDRSTKQGKFAEKETSGKNQAAPTKMMGMENALVGKPEQSGRKNIINEKIEEKVEEKVNKVVNQETEEGLV
jgi:hypothetical protein